MLRQRRYRKALVIYTQLSSIFLRSEFYNPAKVTLEHITLRWMLSDGAGAMVLSLADGDESRPELLDAYVESVGSDRPAGMKMELGAECGPALANLPAPFLHSIHESGRHHLWQDVVAVSGLAAEYALNGLRNMLDAFGVIPDEVSTFVLPFPGRHFISDKHRDLFANVIGREGEARVPFLVAQFGYCGGAASLVQFDHMARQGMFHTDDLIAVYVEESSKWMSGGFLVRWA
jgi:3-oxoacyl-[acyl-carrier-protein] synthase III